MRQLNYYCYWRGKILSLFYSSLSIANIIIIIRIAATILQGSKFFRKKTRHWLYVFIKKGTVNLSKCETTTRSHDVFCALTQPWGLSCPFNCPIIPSNLKHDAHTVLLVLKSGWWWPITCEFFLEFWLILK